GIGRLDWFDFFAYADGYDETKEKYIGLRTKEHATVRIDSASVLVKPEVAQKQIDRENEERAAKVGGADQRGQVTNPGDPVREPGSTTSSGDETEDPAQPAHPRLPTRYHANVPLNLNKL